MLFTNHQFYIDEFIKLGHALMADASGAHDYAAFVEPGNVLSRRAGLAAEPGDDVGVPPPRLPQMPAYHLVRNDRAGITMVRNIGVGPANAKTITDHIAVLRPYAWIMLGHCAGLRNTQQLGDYVLAHGYVREDHVLDEELPLWVPIPPLAEVQVAIEAAVADVTRLEGYELKRLMRTGTVASTDNRNWELLPSHDAPSSPERRFSQSRAIALDMESATIAANGFRFRVPYGTLLCVSDKPLHGEIKLPGMANHFYRGGSTSTCASASAPSSCCASTAWTACTVASSGASTRWLSSSGTASSALCVANNGLPRGAGAVPVAPGRARLCGTRQSMTRGSDGPCASACRCRRFAATCRQGGYTPIRNHTNEIAMTVPPAPVLTLANGIEMPQLALGTWAMNDAEAAVAITAALEMGYRAIDTAENYGNERGVGQGIRSASVKREDVFVTTKFNRDWHSVDGVAIACQASLERLGTDYIDLMLVHWPNPDQDRYVEAFQGARTPARGGLGAGHRDVELQARASAAPVRSGPGAACQPDPARSLASPRRARRAPS